MVSNETLVSSIHRGNKHEFSFVMKQQLGYAGVPGRKQVMWSENGIFNNEVFKNFNFKRVKSCRGNK